MGPRNRALLSVALALAGGCTRHAVPRQLGSLVYPRIVLVTFDTQHVEFTSLLNPQVSYTPNLQALAVAGVTFRRAHTFVPMTLPSHSALFSGRSPVDVGVLTNGDVVPPEVETLAERLAALGYRTAAFTSLAVLRSEQGLDQGFETYDDEPGAGGRRWYRSANEVFAPAAEWLQDHAEEPFFLWLHLSDPHEPYESPGSPPDARLFLDERPMADLHLDSRERHDVRIDLPVGTHRLEWRPTRDTSGRTTLALRFRDVAELAPLVIGAAPSSARFVPLHQVFGLTLENRTIGPLTVRFSFDGRLDWPPLAEMLEQYRLEVALADRKLGELRRLIAALPRGEDTLWLIASDHGEGLYRQGVLGHAAYVFEDQLRIFLLLAGPGLPAGHAVETPGVLIEDIAPTVLALLGQPPSHGMTGIDLAQCWSGGSCPGRNSWWAYAADESERKLMGVVVYEPPFKCFWQETPRSGCFDIDRDPWETDNLAKAYTRAPETRPPEVLRATAAMERLRASLGERLAGTQRSMTREQEDLLRSLGYLGE
jgi:arylsulfatase A-like enzyme